VASSGSRLFLVHHGPAADLAIEPRSKRADRDRVVAGLDPAGLDGAERLPVEDFDLGDRLRTCLTTPERRVVVFRTSTR
jgi:hypothetical protein